MKSLGYLYQLPTGSTGWLLLLFVTIFSTCQGQQTNERETRIATVGDVPTATTPAVDPLFFIDGQLCQHLRVMHQDQRGHLWFGTNVYGLMRYDGDTLGYFDAAAGFPSGRITGIVEDAAGNVWFGSAAGLTRYDGQTFTHFAEEDGLADAEIWSLHLDRAGIFWLGTNSGLSRFDGETFTNSAVPKTAVADTNTIYAYDRITDIVEDSAGTLWLGTDGFGICRYDGQTFTHLTTADGLCDNTIAELLIDTRGDLWIGTFWGGVCRYDGQAFTNFTKDGLIDGVEVGAFYEDKNGDIWFAAENQGVYRYDGQTFTHYTEEQGLLTNGVLSIYRDREDRFWFGGWGGLFRYDGRSFGPVTKDGPWEQ